MFDIERVVRVVSPLVRVGWPANLGVLVEVEQILILEDCKVVPVKLAKLHDVRYWPFLGHALTSVPIIKGAFIIAQRAK